MRIFFAKPAMIDHPSLPFKIAAKQVRVGEFKRALANYEIRGNNALYLQAQLDNEAIAGRIVTHVNLYDGLALAAEMNRQNPGHHYRLPTEAEWNAVLARPLLADSLHDGYWNWTATESAPGSGEYILRSLVGEMRYQSHPSFRYSSFALRLVEDKSDLGGVGLEPTTFSV